MEEAEKKKMAAEPERVKVERSKAYQELLQKECQDRESVAEFDRKTKAYDESVGGAIDNFMTPAVGVLILLFRIAWKVGLLLVVLFGIVRLVKYFWYF
jgi:Flp pilus assembly protein TadB